MNKFLKVFFSFAVIMVVFFVGFFLISHVYKIQTPDSIKYVQIAGQSIKVDLALTAQEQEQGLSGRQSLGQNEGMLFVFDNPSKELFWMKDMNFPIDIIWLTENMKVDYIKKYADPKLYPEAYGPGQNDMNAKYVLEVVAGFSDKNNLKVGDAVLFSS
jgi:uncharacterized membrane protein (UPF0127 family)